MTKYIDKLASLTPETKNIICESHTERPYTGRYNSVLSQGSYLCRRCGLALFRANSQFDSGCGWPSFDVEIANAVKHQPDPDGMRIEIVCSRCEGHLGHIFTGEYLTPQNRRYCVNALSLDYVENNDVIDSEEAILAGGCFWGIEYFLQKVFGVLKVESGYIGGSAYPSYEQVCAGNTGHYEAVRVIYDNAKTNYFNIVKRFFEIHDPCQVMGQGPDLGFQYQSAIFYFNAAQQQTAQELVRRLKDKGYPVVTKLAAAQLFWAAEDYHQDYYTKHQKIPYCHHPVMRFD